MFNETSINFTKCFLRQKAKGLQKYTYLDATYKRPKRDDRVTFSVLPMKTIYNSLLIFSFFCQNQAIFSFS